MAAGWLAGKSKASVAHPRPNECSKPDLLQPHALLSALNTKGNNHHTHGLIRTPTRVALNIVHVWMQQFLSWSHFANSHFNKFGLKILRMVQYQISECGHILLYPLCSSWPSVTLCTGKAKNHHQTLTLSGSKIYPCFLNVSTKALSYTWLLLQNTYIDSPIAAATTSRMMAKADAGFMITPSCCFPFSHSGKSEMKKKKKCRGFTFRKTGQEGRNVNTAQLTLTDCSHSRKLLCIHEFNYRKLESNSGKFAVYT